jgi:hypothetical protein
MELTLAGWREKSWAMVLTSGESYPSRLPILAATALVTRRRETANDMAFLLFHWEVGFRSYWQHRERRRSNCYYTTAEYESFVTFALIHNLMKRFHQMKGWENSHQAFGVYYVSPIFEPFLRRYIDSYNSFDLHIILEGTELEFDVSTAFALIVKSIDLSPRIDDAGRTDSSITI